MKRADVVVITATKKKQYPHSEKATTVVPFFTRPTLVVAPAAPTRPSIRPHPEVKTTDTIAWPQKCIKKKVKKGEQEIHVISSQTT